MRNAKFRPSNGGPLGGFVVSVPRSPWRLDPATMLTGSSPTADALTHRDAALIIEQSLERPDGEGQLAGASGRAGRRLRSP
ncbi:MAG: hypothetical protein ACRDL0_09030, partial [Thermoleophilaceae bacterium]